jgi:hypothetical protein
MFFNKATAQIGINARLLARSHFASGRSCDRPARSRFSVVLLGPRAYAELVPNCTKTDRLTLCRNIALKETMQYI